MPIYPKSFVRDAGVRRLEKTGQQLDYQIDQAMQKIGQYSEQTPAIPELPQEPTPNFTAPLTEEAPSPAAAPELPFVGTQGPGQGAFTAGLFAADPLSTMQEAESQSQNAMTPLSDELMDDTFNQEPYQENFEDVGYGEEFNFVNSAGGGGGRTDVRQWGGLISEAASRYGVPQSVIAGIMEIESGGNSEAVSPAGAKGLMQVMPFHFKEGENGMDPRTNVFKGAQILAENYRRYGSWEKASAAYFGAISASGEITGASDAVGQTGYGYVGAFTNSRAQYADMDSQEASPLNVFDEAGNYIKSKGRDLMKVFEGSLTPDQMGLSNYAAAVAACGPAAVAAFVARSGRMPDLEEITALAQEKGLWSPGTGMLGAQAQIKLMDLNGIKATAESGIANANRILQDLAAGNPVSFSGKAHYWTIEGFNPSTGKFDFGRSATVMGAPEFMTLQELANRDTIQDTIFADNPLTDGASYATDYLSQDMNPLESLGQFKDRLTNQLFGDIQDIGSSLQGMEFGGGQPDLDFGGPPDGNNNDLIKQANEQLNSAINSILESGAGQMIGSAAMSSTERLRANVGDVLSEPFTQEARDVRQQLVENSDWGELTKNILGSGVKAGLGVVPAITIGVIQDALPWTRDVRPFPSLDNPEDSAENWGPLELVANIGAVPTALERGIAFGGSRLARAGAGGLSKISVQAAIVEPVVKTLNGVGAFIEGSGVGGLFAPQAEAAGVGRIPFNLRPGEAIDQMSGMGGRSLPTPPQDEWEQLETYIFKNGGATYDPTNKRYWTTDGYAVGGVVDPGSKIQTPTVREVFTLQDDGRWLNEQGIQPREVARTYYENFKNTLDQNGVHIGAWVQDVEGADPNKVKELFFDASEVFGDLPNARRESLRRGQQATYRFGDEEKGLPSGDVRVMTEARSEGIQRALAAGRSVEDDPLLEIANREARNIQDLDPESHFGVNTLEDRAFKDLKEAIASDPTTRTDVNKMKQALGIGTVVQDFLPHMPSFQDFVDAAKAGARFTPWYREIGEYHSDKYPKLAEEAGRFHFGPSSQLAPPEDNEIRTQLMLIASRELKPEIDRVLAGPKNNWDKVGELTTLLRNRMEGEFTGANVSKTKRDGTETTAWNRKAIQTKPGLVQELGLSHDPGFLGNQAKVVARGIVFGDISNPGVKASVYGPSTVSATSDAVAPMYAVLDTHHWRGSGAWNPEVIKNLISAGKTVTSPELGNWKVNQALQRLVGEEVGMNIAEVQAAEWVVFRTVAANVRNWQERIANGEKWHDIFNELVARDPGIVDRGGGTAAAFRENRDIEIGSARVKEIEDMPSPGLLGAAVNTNNRGLDVSGVVPRGLGPTPARPFDPASVEPQAGQSGIQRAGMGLFGAGAGSETIDSEDEGTRELNPLQTGAMAVGAVVTANPRLAQRIAQAWSTRPQAIPQGNPNQTGSVANRLLYNSMLSSTTTALQNVFTGATEVFWKGWIDALEDRSLGTLTEEMRGAVAGIGRGIESALQVARYGYSDIQVNRAQAFGSTVAPGAAGGNLGPHNLAVRALAAGDEFFYNIVYSMEIHRQAVKEVRALGKTPGQQPLPLWPTVDQAIQNPSQTMLAAAKSAADEATFRNDLGRLGEGIEKAAKNAGPLGTIVMPFTNALMNITARGLERTPGIGLIGLVGRVNRGEMTAARAGAIQGTSIALAATAAMMYESGTLVGSGPRDPNERKRLQREGFQPNSIKLPNGQYRSIEQLGPVAAPLLAVVNALDAFKYDAKKDSEDSLGTNFAQAAQNFITMQIDNSVLSGIADVVELASSRSPETAVGKYLGGVAGRAIPGLANQVARANDPFMRETEGDDLLETAKNSVIQRIPGARGTLPERLGPLGERVPNPQQGGESFMPFRAGPLPSETPAERTLESYDIPVSDMKKRQIGDTELDTGLQQTYRFTYGMQVQAAVSELEKDPTFQKASREEQKQMLEASVGTIRQATDEVVLAMAGGMRKSKRPDGQPSKYEGVDDWREEVAIDHSISRVSAWIQDIKSGVDSPEPSEADWEIYGNYYRNYTIDYIDYLTNREAARRYGTMVGRRQGAN